MKFLHLSDLHIGKTVNGFSMLEDQAFIFEQIIRYIGEYRPEAVVIAGDVYDKPAPGVDAVKVFDQFLTELVHSGVTVMAVSGNHDSPERLAFAHRIMAEESVYLYGVFDGGMRTVTLEDAYGEVHFHLLPFIRPISVRGFFPDLQDDEAQSYFHAVKTVVESRPIDPTKRNVLVAHQFFIASGAEPERCESEIGPVGGIDSVDTSAISGFDYVALGHLHGAQRVGSECVRYAGSPLKYSFSECHHNKSASLIELSEKGAVNITPLPLTPLRDMRKIKGPLAELIREETRAAGNPEDYLQVTLTDEDEIFDAIGKIRSVYPNVMALAFENARTAASLDLSAAVNMDAVTPLELFESFFLEQNGASAKPEQRHIIKALMEQMGGLV